MRKQDKIAAINKAIQEYFDANPGANKVPAKDLMRCFILKSIFEKDHRTGLPIRSLLRGLDANGELNKIPYVLAERKGVNTNWYFLRPREGSVAQVTIGLSEKSVPHSPKASKPPINRRSNKDEHYVIDLCDAVLNQKALRQHKFDFLRGDSQKGKLGVKLPVDAYYEELNLVIEFREKQHTEEVKFFDKPDKITVSGVSRGEQRKIYDQRRRDLLPTNGIKLIEISYFDFEFNNKKRILRNKTIDLKRVEEIFKQNNITGK